MSSETPNKNNVMTMASWVRNTLNQLGDTSRPRIGLFESSIAEPTHLLSEAVGLAFEKGAPTSFVSVFMRNHPGLEQWLSDRYHVPKENILCTSGATMAVSYILEALCRPGEHVVSEAPGFDIFRIAAALEHLEHDVFQRAEPDFRVDPEAVLATLKPTTRVVIVSDPHNPSGLGMDQETLGQLSRELRSRQITLLIDEVYRDYSEVFSDGLDILEHPNVVRVGSMTKNFGLNALRVGWMFVGDDILQRVRDHLRLADFTVSKLSHSIAAEVVNHSDRFDAFRRDIMATATPIVEDWLSKMVEEGHFESIPPLEGCICFPQLRNITDTNEFSSWLAETCSVIVVPGECFGAPGFIRIGFAREESVLREGLRQLELGLIKYAEIQNSPQKTFARN